MRKPDRARPAGGTGELQMAPLIDTVFLLLTYFLFTISLATIEGLLPSELALGDDYREETLDLEKENQEVVIRLVQTGTRVQYFINDWPAFGFDSVRTRLDELTADDVVVIDPGPTVTYEHVVRLYNYCLRVGVERVVFPLASASAAAARM